MQALKKFIANKSIRKQYLYLAVLLAGVVVAYTWFTGAWIQDTGQTRVNNIEKRIAIAEITNRIRLSIIDADNTLELFLLSPSIDVRIQFESELERAEAQIDDVSAGGDSLLNALYRQDGREYIKRDTRMAGAFTGGNVSTLIIGAANNELETVT